MKVFKECKSECPERCMCCKDASSNMYVALSRCVFECLVVIFPTRQTMLPFCVHSNGLPCVM